MKHLVLGLAAISFLSTGCIAVRVPVGTSRSAVSAKKCPPGHQWSDGRCHGKGKGHDPAKHDG
jgi:hypothetical protein